MEICRFYGTFYQLLILIHSLPFCIRSLAIQTGVFSSPTVVLNAPYPAAIPSSVYGSRKSLH